jgi:pectate lyase
LVPKFAALHTGLDSLRSTDKIRAMKRAACLGLLLFAFASLARAAAPLATTFVAQLIAFPASTEELVGFAAVAGDTTGGGDAIPTTVTTFAELATAAQDPAPRVIIVSGIIKTEGGSGMKIGSNKTISGADKKATIFGGLSLDSVSNVILRNFNLQGIWPNSGPDDAIAVRNSHHVWIDHLNIWDGGDGNLDITRESSYVTVSWCKFWYTDKRHPHRLCALIGSGGGDHPEDWGKLKVTYHHNWFADLVDQRMPRLMYGQAHVFNNYYTATDNSYCIGVGSYGAALIENNYFKNVKSPHTFMYDVYCDITAQGNIYENTTGKKDTGRGGNRDVSGQKFPVSAFTAAPYRYTLDKAEDVPARVSRYAGPQ